MSKFVRRHCIAAALAGILAVAVVALGVQLAVTNGRLAKERDLAIHERSNAREVSNFMVELFGNSRRETDSGSEITAREMLDLVHEQNFGKVHATRAKGLRFLGMAKVLAGDKAEAEMHFKKAIELWRILGLAEDPEFAELMLEAAKASMADGRLAEAEPRLRFALQVQERLLMSSGLAEATKVQLARRLHAQGKREEARSLAAGVLQQYSKVPPEVRGQVEEARALLARMEIPRGDE